MFEQAVLSSGPAAKRVWTTSLGMAGQVLVVGGAVLLTVIWPQALPMAMLMTRIEAPGPPPPPPVAPGPQVRPHGTVRPTAPVYPGPLTEPRSVPAVVATIIDPPPEAGGGSMPTCIGCVPGSVLGSVPLLNDTVRPPVLSPRPTETSRTEPVKPAATEPIRIHVSELRMARLVHRVEPIYPTLARQMRIQGVVQIDAVVAVDGHMRELRVVSGHPLLAPAAIEAVRQWIYEPTVLNGARVEVGAPITVNFKLN